MSCREVAYEDFRARRAREKENEQFPDEVDTPHDVAARLRFQKYRGLKSFRHSEWHPKESLPRDYAYIYQLPSYEAVQVRGNTLARVMSRGSYAGPMRSDEC